MHCHGPDKPLGTTSVCIICYSANLVSVYQSNHLLSTGCTYNALITLHPSTIVNLIFLIIGNYWYHLESKIHGTKNQDRPSTQDSCLYIYSLYTLSKLIIEIDGDAMINISLILFLTFANSGFLPSATFFINYAENPLDARRGAFLLLLRLNLEVLVVILRLRLHHLQLFQYPLDPAHTWLGSYDTMID